jgi:putative tryptophan/tyrosine transport system substrate-binding protein
LPIDSSAPLRSQPSPSRGEGRKVTRRAALTLLGSAALWPLVAQAQQAAKVFRVGYLGLTREAPGTGTLYDIFLDELKENGFIEGRNLVVEARPIDDPRGTAAVGAELVQMKPDVIVAQGPEAALKAVLDAKSRVPIVFQAVNYDPVERGYVASVARPGGNITGVFFRQPELAAKKVELLAQAFPERKHLAILWDGLVEMSSSARRARQTTSISRFMR